MATVQVHATLYWRLVFEYNNLDNNGTSSLVWLPSFHSRTFRTVAGSIIHSFEIETYTKSTRTAFAESVSKTAVETLTEAGSNVEAGGSYGPVSAKVQKSFGQKHSLEDMLQKTTRESGEDVSQVTTKVKRECESLHLILHTVCVL